MMDVRTILLAVLVAGAALGGWTARGWKEDAGRLEAERTAHARDVAVVEGWAAANQIITTGRESDRQQAAAERRKWQKEIDDAKRKGPLVVCGEGLRQDAPSAAGDGAAALSGAAVRLWNGALDVGLPDALRTWRADGAGQGADLPVAIDDAFDNHAANADACNDLRGQALAWQAWARSIGAAK